MKGKPDFGHHPLVASVPAVLLLVRFRHNHHKRASNGALHLQLVQADLSRREKQVHLVGNKLTRPLVPSRPQTPSAVPFRQ